MKWWFPLLGIGVLLAAQAVRIALLAQSDPQGAVRDTGIGVGIITIAAAIIVVVQRVRTGHRPSRRRSLGPAWIGDVIVRPLERLRLHDADAAPRDYALWIAEDELRLSATAGSEPVLAVPSGEIRSVEVIEIPDGGTFEYAVEVGTDDGPLWIAPASALGFPRSPRAAAGIADRVAWLLPENVRPPGLA